jgi:predicted flap endonuclease-1-like 5' DNA nuclease
MDRKDARWEILLITVLSALFFFWWIRQLQKEEKPLKEERAPVRSKSLVLSPRPAARTPVEAPPPSPEPPVEPDDLRRIEGIGPKISGALQAAGITTFAQVASSTPEELHRMVKAAGVRVAFPESWPEQAGLAAKGDWEALKTLQSTLKGGRRA